MLIRSSKRQLQALPESFTPKASPNRFSASFPLDERTIEIPEVLLSLSGLQESVPGLGHTFRAGVGSLALLKSFQSFTRDEGALTKLDGFSSLGLAVAAGGSIVGGPVGHSVSLAAESVHGMCEIALGIAELNSAEQGRESLSAALGITKGLTTFVPMMGPGAQTAVGILHLGILTARAVLATRSSSEA